MASNARMELGKIKRSSTILQKKLYSSDPAAAKKAEAQLADIGKALSAWSRKYHVKLTPHVETHPAGEARRRKCAPVVDADVGGEPMDCFLMGKQGRNCLYRCVPKLIGVEF